MLTADATLRDRYGLHPRAAMRITQVAAGHASTLTIERLDPPGAAISARAMIGLVSAGIRSGERVRITGDGPDEVAAVQALATLLEGGVCHP